MYIFGSTSYVAEDKRKYEISRSSRPTVITLIYSYCSNKFMSAASEFLEHTNKIIYNEKSLKFQVSKLFFKKVFNIISSEFPCNENWNLLGEKKNVIN